MESIDHLYDLDHLLVAIPEADYIVSSCQVRMKRRAFCKKNTSKP
ncbi:hypothetical protein ABGT24_08675 [Peribacillus frigoritolerans]